MHHPHIPAPADMAELERRARQLVGRRVDELARDFAADSTAPMVRRKGKTGQLIERALGASAGSLRAPDFVGLGVELKTIPVDREGRPRESTFVCSCSLRDADRAEWETSVVRAKLSHVLFVPIVQPPSQSGGHASPSIGEPLFWQPTPAQEAVLRADFDDLVGLIALGSIEALTGRLGRWLQLRPKAAHSRVRTRAYAGDDEPITALPRGFYLRTRFTAALLRPASVGSP